MRARKVPKNFPKKHRKSQTKSARGDIHGVEGHDGQRPQHGQAQQRVFGKNHVEVLGQKLERGRMEDESGKKVANRGRKHFTRHAHRKAPHRPQRQAAEDQQRKRGEEYGVAQREGQQNAHRQREGREVRDGLEQLAGG